jgi:EmrB/QacA subfamily drug resistance transporter
LSLVLGALMLAVFLSSLEGSIIATALPTIAGEFNAFESFAWVGTAYSITSTIATPLLGKLSDLYGRRLVFQSTMGIFLLGSLLCGLADSMGQLIAFRAVQGIGGGGIQALAFAILGDIIPPRERGRYIGWFTLSFVGAAVVGPLLGGFIIETTSWQWIFLINIPFCVVVAAICQVALRLPFQRRSAQLDLLGAALLTGGLTCLMLGLAEGDRNRIGGGTVALFASAGVLLVLFGFQERRAPEPMIPLRLFANPVVLSCATMGFFVGMVVYGGNQFLPLYFQDALLVSPTESGLRMLPVMVGVTLGTFGVGRLVSKTGRYAIYPRVGTVLALAGVLAIAQIDGATPYLLLVVPMALMGLGVSSAFSVSSIATQNSVDFRDMGVATATVLFFRSLGGSLGLAMFGTVVNATIRTEIPARTDVAASEAADLIREPSTIAALPEATRDAVIDSIALGVSRVYWISTVLMAAAAVCAFLLPERPLGTRAHLSDAMEGSNA